MYAEFNESENAARDWELSVEFYPEEQAEYEFYVAAQRQKPVCAEVPQQTDYEASLEAAWPRKRVHKRVLQLARDEARVHQD